MHSKVKGGVIGEAGETVVTGGTVEGAGEAFIAMGRFVGLC
jgi:hypothetical protein